MRIVCLLPAATEIACALGLRGSLVGRSHECDFPAGVESLPALTRARVDSSLASGRLDDEVRRLRAGGSGGTRESPQFEERARIDSARAKAATPLYLLDEERLAVLAPDVIVTQAACDVCAVSYEQVAEVTRRAVPAARVVCLLPSRLDDVLEDVARVAAACDVRDRGVALADDLRRRLDSAAHDGDEPSSKSERGFIPRERKRPRVAVVEWLEPPMLAGHWVPDVVAAAGGLFVGPAPGAMSPYAAWDEVRALEPDAVVVAPCGFDLERTRREAAPFADTLRSLAPRVLLMDGNAYLNRPGPRLVEAAEILAAWLAGRGGGVVL